jgi:hypothetical protein
VVIPTFLFLILYQYSPIAFSLYALKGKSFWAVLGIVFAYTAIFPSFIVFWLYKKKVIGSVELHSQKDRPSTFLLCSAFYFALGYFMYKKGGVLLPFSSLILIMALNIIGLAAISKKMKISAHAAAISGLIGILGCSIYLLNQSSLLLPMLGSIIIAGFVGTSRLHLEAHTLKELVFGYLWGIFSSIVGFLIIF